VDVLTIAYERFANQARFIQMFIKGEIKISNRDLSEIVRDLRRLKFRPFPKVVKPHVAADPDASMVISPEDDLEETDDESAAGDLHDYDYLLEMPISSLTVTKVGYFGSLLRCYSS
jgi:DNA topoisomerase-2